MKISNGVPLPLGCTVNGNNINFAFQSTSGKDAKVVLYKKGSKHPYKEIKLEKGVVAGNIGFVAVELDHPDDYEYNFKVDDELILDPYSKKITGREKWMEKRDLQKSEIRSCILVPDHILDDDKPLKLPFSDVIAYSLHVRGFTKHASSKVKNRGTFDGLMEKIPYFKELGINQIQCMPVYDFEENLKYTNYWGYGEGNYFAPKAAYAATDAVEEMKNLVLALHKAGIEIILEMPFCATTGKVLMIECLRYWAMEYHIDGFILNPTLLDFDLLKSDPVISQVKLLKKQDDYQNSMRRFLKGDEGMIPEIIYRMKHISEDHSSENYIAGHNGFTLNDVVSYDGKHNELNGEDNKDGPDYNYSRNCGTEGPSRKKSVVALRKKQVYNALFLLMFSQGTPCLLAGDEFYNTQKGNNNVYCQDNSLSWLDWKKLDADPKLFEFVKELIRFRKEHKLLHPEREMCGMAGKCGIPDVSYHGESAWRAPDCVASRQIGIYYHDTVKDQDDIYIAYNMHWMPHTFALPTLPKGKVWVQAGSTDDGMTDSSKCQDIVKKEIELEERTIKVFVGKQEEV